MIFWEPWPSAARQRGEEGFRVSRGTRDLLQLGGYPHQDPHSQDSATAQRIHDYYPEDVKQEYQGNADGIY